MSSLTKRVLTAVVLGAVFLAVLFKTNPEITAGFITLFLLLACWEWAGFAGWQSVAARLMYVALAACLMAALFLSPDLTAVLPVVLLVAACWWLFALFMLFSGAFPLNAPLIALCGFLLLIPAWFCGIRILLAGDNGNILFLLVFLFVAAADIGAYFTGKAIGSHKLLPRVSPGKTWEGFAGGMISATLLAGVVVVLLDWPLMPALLTGLLTGLVSVVGDLTVSLFKRHAGLKDSGKLLPGHGGILDRIDGVTAALPLYAALLYGFGLLPAATL